MRSLTLAAALRDAGAKVVFVCREHDGHLCDLIEQRGFTVKRLAKRVGGSSSSEPQWLGASQETDAAETRAALSAETEPLEWLVIDHYGIDRRWENELRGLVRRIMVIDDLADRAHDCDLLLDQNLIESMESRYTGLVPEGCVTLLGPRYALLQPDYARLHLRTPPRSGPIERILVSFGGADATNLAGRTVAAFLSIQRQDIEMDVVAGASEPRFAALREQFRLHSNVFIHSHQPSLASLMVKADIAIGGGGSTCWERLCLGLPSLVVTLAPNQRPIAAELDKRGLIRLLGNFDEIEEADIAVAVGKLCSQPLDGRWSAACSEVVDGRGAERVCAAMTMSGATPVRARGATFADGNSRSSTPELQRQFRRCLREIDRCASYVVTVPGDLTIAEVRFERLADCWEVNWIPDTALGANAFRRSSVAAAITSFREDSQGMLVLRDHDAADRDSRGANTLRISVCADSESWINPHIARMLSKWLNDGHTVTWTSDAALLSPGDLCFFLSYGRIVDGRTLGLHHHNLVVHASDLPKGRGWSPMTWQVLEGRREIPVTLFEAAEAVDSGPIFDQCWLQTSGLELIDELREALGRATTELCERFVAEYPESASTSRPQQGQPTFYAKRRPRDSRIDIDRTLREQINLLRIADPERYPAWFELENARFGVFLKRLDADNR